MKKTITYITLLIGITSYAQLETINTTYSYDNLNRLVQVVSNGEIIHTYVYDDIGNRLELDIDTGGDPDLTYVPDDAFEQKLIDEGYDDVMDDYVLTANINGIEEFSLFNLGVSDLTGIEDFSALNFFEASQNQISEADFSHNNNLSVLLINGNQLNTIELGNIPLVELNIGNNLFTNFDASILPQLVYLSINANSLSNINLLGLDNLQVLYIHNNPLSEIELTGITNISLLSCFNTNIQTLDVSQQTNLSTLQTFNTNLNSLNLKNGFNQNLVVMTATGNPNLTCIQVDDEINANAGNGVYGDWQVDTIVTFSEDCEALSIDDNELSTIIIFPNPTDGLLQIVIPNTISDRDIQYQVLDVNGRRVLNGSIESGESSQTINMKELSTGNYFLKFISDNKTWTTQIIKK